MTFISAPNDFRKPKTIIFKDAIRFMLSSSFTYLPTFFHGQAPGFETEILKFEQEDQQNGYRKDFILFTGSSSIRLWESMESDMKGLKVLNRGFGGSTLRELNHYWVRISSNHQPELVVVYCGENDINQGSSVSETVAEFEKFLDQYQQTYPETPMIYIAMKPSTSRWQLWEQFQAADAQIKALIAQNDWVSFIDLSPSMLKKDGNLKEDIFIEDGLHMNKKGYKGWTKLLKPLIHEKLETP